MTTEVVLPFQVRRLAFAYEERPGSSKERPVVVGHVSEDEAVVLVVKVTRHGPRPGFPGEVRLLDWEEAGVAKPSVARCSKVALVDLGLLEAAPLYERLSARDAAAVERGLREAGWARG